MKIPYATRLETARWLCRLQAKILARRRLKLGLRTWVNPARVQYIIEGDG